MDDEDLRAALVFGEARQLLDQQAGVVDIVRSRAGILLSAASIATSFLAGIAIPKGEGLRLFWSGPAALAFGVVVGLCVTILWPTRNWKFSSNPTDLVRSYLDPTDVSLARAQRNLALWAQQWADGNAEKLRTMFILFEVACAFLAAEVAFWIFDLWRG
jgi:hypothetical protein